MKKLLLLTLSVLTCGVAVALPVGNPSEASLYTNGMWWSKNYCEPCDPCFTWLDSFSLRLGFYGDYVFNRHLERENSAAYHRGINDTELFTNAGIIVLNFCDWIEAFATVGASDLSISTNSDSFALGAASGKLIDLGFETKFSWSVGGRATVWSCDAFSVGVEGQYFRFQPNLDYLVEFDGGAITYFNGASSTYSEWQVGLGASYRWQTGCPGFAMVPYVAVKWAQSKLSMNALAATTGVGTYHFYDLQSYKLWGYAVGLTGTVNDVVGASVEARFGDEKAVYTTMQVRF